MKQFYLCLLFSLLTSNLLAQKFHTTIGESFPSFEVEALNGEFVTNATLKGKPSLIVFFGTRCPPCMKELKALNEKLPDTWYTNFNIYAVASTDDDERLLSFSARHSFKFNYISDPNQDLFNVIGDHTIPRTFLLDANGVILSQTVGFYKTPFENLMKRMQALL